jgi:hypothetical protein
MGLKSDTWATQSRRIFGNFGDHDAMDASNFVTFPAVEFFNHGAFVLERYQGRGVDVMMSISRSSSMWKRISVLRSADRQHLFHFEVNASIVRTGFAKDG